MATLLGESCISVSYVRDYQTKIYHVTRLMDILLRLLSFERRLTVVFIRLPLNHLEHIARSPNHFFPIGPVDTLVCRFADHDRNPNYYIKI